MGPAYASAKPGGDGPDVATRRKGLISAVVVTSELKARGGGLGGG